MLYLCVLCTKFCLCQFAIAVSVKLKHHWSSLFANTSSVSYFLIHFLENIFRSCIQYRPLFVFSTNFWNTAIIELQPNIVNDACLVFYSIMCNRIHGFTHFSLTLRRLMSYIYGAPILDVSRSHTTTQHRR